MLEPNVREMSEELDRLLCAVDEDSNPAARQRVRDIVHLVMRLHGEGLRAVVELGGDPALGGDALVTRLSDHPIVGPLLVMHGLHPHDAATRLARALDRLRPRIAAAGCRAQLADAGPDHAVVRVEGRARLAPESRTAFTTFLETALVDAAPDVTDIRLEDIMGSEPAPAASPLIQILRSAPQT
jgi:hypothetical protein